MRKLIIIGMFLLLTIAVFGQVNLSLGADAGFTLSTMSDKRTVDTNNYLQSTQSDKVVTASAFFDATYIRLNVIYERSIAATIEQKVVASGSASTSSNNSTAGYYQNVLYLRLLGKYPFDFGNVKLWPTAGIMYSILLSIDANGDGTAEDLTSYDMGDFYIVGGCGLDAFITDQIYFTVVALFDWNCTPIPIKNYTPPSSYTDSWWQWQFSTEAGIGFKF